MNALHYIERPPRLQPELPHNEVEIPPPPPEEKEAGQPLIQIGLPLLTIAGTVLISVFGQGRSPLLMLPMGLSVIISVGMAFYTRHQKGRHKGEKQAAYAERLVELRKEMTAAQNIQRRFYCHNYPDPSGAFQIAAAAHAGAVDGQANNGAGTRLWERRTSDPDFGALRLGLGTLPSTTVYTFKAEGGFDDPLARDAMRLAADSSFVTGVPITIALRPSPTGRPGEAASTSARHALGVVGRQASAAYSFIEAILVHYTIFHAPTDARLYILGLEEVRQAWRWAGRLPHCAASKPNETLCFEDQADRAGAKERSNVYAFLRGLRAVLEERKLRLEDADNNLNVTLPHLLVVVDWLPPLPEGSALHDLEMDPAISLLLNEGPRLGASVIFLVPHSGRVPDGCRAVIDLTAGAPMNGAQEEVGFRYAEVGVNTARFAGRADQVTDGQALAAFAGHLHPLMVRKSYGADLPRSVHMLDILGLQTAEELRQNLRANWQRSQQPDAADWLQAALGMLSGGDIRRLKFSADADGVHGLIAGSTGSGKSELLMTMILGLAYNYDPSIVNFVLVDFKGGAAFEPFRNLPHVVDIVTNLKGSAVERMFAAIMAEIHRREAINVATDAKHIVHYRQKGLHLPPYGQEMVVKGETYYTAPYPHLFVFIDEFAEMIAENPEYKAQLNSITRLGRALGITLILAAQRPTGVTDQMRANIKFRIALRVETREESSEVLRRPDAAYLPTGTPGRGYLQVGNENLELIQVAWTGAEYRGGREQQKPNVIWHDQPQPTPISTEDEELPKVYELMVDAMAELAREHSLPQRKPWPDFLPESMSLQMGIDVSYVNPEDLNLILGTRSGSPAVAASNGDRPSEAETALVPLNRTVTQWLAGEGRWPGVDWETQAMRAVVGLIDNPYHAEQLPLVMDLRRGHTVVFGASGWGKTTFLRTLLATLATTHSPRELHAYVLDFGGRQLSVFRDLPHLGAIITPDEEERVTRLLRMLDTRLEKRKARLSDAGADDLYSYNHSHPDAMLPAILVIIDNFAEFRESFDNLMPLLISLVRESRAYGIHFAVSAELPNALSGKLYSLFTERVALKFSDPVEYTSIVGRGARALEDIPGRGFVKVGRRALEFQTALPAGIVDGGQGLDETQKLAALIRALRDAPFQVVESERPAPINTLASRVLLTQLLPAARPAGQGVRPVLGIDDRSLEPWPFDLRRDGPHCIVIGPPASGKTTSLRSLVLSLATTYTPDEVVLVLADFQQRFFRYGGQHTLGDLPHVAQVLSHSDELEVFIESLEVECEQLASREPKRAIFVIIDNYDSFVEEARSFRSALPALAALARERGTDGLHFVIGGSPDITRSAEELRKQVQMPRMGIALQSADLVSSLNGRVPRSLSGAELPLGRGFVVKSGRTFMLQIATPYEDDEYPETSLDGWVQRIRARYPGQQATWSRRPENEQPEQVAKEEPAAEPVPAGQLAGDGHPLVNQPADEAGPEPPPVLREGISEGVDVEALKSQLLEKGLAESLLGMLSPVDIVNMSVEMEILILDEEGSAKNN